MSILQIVETSPSRVRGLFGQLAAISSHRQQESQLKGLMSPDSLPVPWPLLASEGDADEESEPEAIPDRRASGPQMIDKIINGCERMGLVVRDGDDIALNPSLPSDATSERKRDDRLPRTIAELVFDPARAENHDLAQLIAWYLLHDPLDAPGNEASVISSLHSNLALKDHFGLKNQSYGQFEDWVVYLGFAWAGVSHERKRVINPDPTQFIRQILDEVFDGAPRFTLPAAEVVRLVAERCPVLEGGHHRVQLLLLANMREEPGRLSPATSQSWIRLEEEGRWELLPRSDSGSPVLLTDGTETRQVAAVRLKNQRRPRRKNGQ